MRKWKSLNGLKGEGWEKLGIFLGEQLKNISSHFLNSCFEWLGQMVEIRVCSWRTLETNFLKFFCISCKHSMIRDHIGSLSLGSKYIWAELANQSHCVCSSTIFYMFFFLQFVLWFDYLSHTLSWCVWSNLQHLGSSFHWEDITI